MHSWKLDRAFELAAVGGGHDADSVLSSQELWAQLHRQAQDGSKGKNRLYSFLFTCIIDAINLQIYTGRLYSEL